MNWERDTRNLFETYFSLQVNRENQEPSQTKKIFWMSNIFIFLLVNKSYYMPRNSNGLQVVRAQVRFFHSVPRSKETHDLIVV